MKLTTLHATSYPTAPILEFERVRPQTGSDLFDILISNVYEKICTKVVELVVVLQMH